MAHSLPDLPYPHDALAPHVSRETMEFHHDKHHAAYVNKLNELAGGTEYAAKPLEDIIRSAPPGPIFNNAAQVWNHTFYFQCMSPRGGGEPTGALRTAIEARWGDIATFKAEFAKAAAGNFGSGWTWLVKKPDGTLDITNTGNAATPLTGADRPVLACDVWEHAYYIDTRNARPKYVENWWNVVDWGFVARNFGG